MLYAAYGSNLNVEQMKWRCPNATIVTTAEIKDYRLLFKGSKTGSYLTIEPAPGYSVPVGIWRVTDSDIDALNHYEGYPAFYYKKSFNILCSDGKRHKVFAYIMHEDRPFGIPNSYYVDVCESGYDSFGFDKYKLYQAIEYSNRKLRYHKVKVS